MGGAEQEVKEAGEKVKGVKLDLSERKVEGLGKRGGLFIDGRQKEDTNVIFRTAPQ